MAHSCEGIWVAEMLDSDIQLMLGERTDHCGGGVHVKAMLRAMAKKRYAPQKKGKPLHNNAIPFETYGVKHTQMLDGDRRFACKASPSWTCLSNGSRINKGQPPLRGLCNGQVVRCERKR